MGRWIREGYAWGDGFVRAMHEGIGVCVFVCVCVDGFLLRDTSVVADSQPVASTLKSCLDGKRSRELRQLALTQERLITPRPPWPHDVDSKDTAPCLATPMTCSRYIQQPVSYNHLDMQGRLVVTMLGLAPRDSFPEPRAWL
jgi:hypothetical protein